MNRAEFERIWGVEVIDGLWCAHCWLKGSKRNCTKGHPGCYLPCQPPGDHRYRVVHTDTGARGLLSQPYDFGSQWDHAAKLTAWCNAHGCEWKAVGEGWHHPATVAVFIFPERAATHGGPAPAVPVHWGA